MIHTILLTLILSSPTPVIAELPEHAYDEKFLPAEVASKKQIIFHVNRDSAVKQELTGDWSKRVPAHVLKGMSKIQRGYAEEYMRQMGRKQKALLKYFDITFQETSGREYVKFQSLEFVYIPLSPRRRESGAWLNWLACVQKDYWFKYYCISVLDKNKSLLKEYEKEEEVRKVAFLNKHPELVAIGFSTSGMWYWEEYVGYQRYYRLEMAGYVPGERKKLLRLPTKPVMPFGCNPFKVLD